MTDSPLTTLAAIVRDCIYGLREQPHITREDVAVVLERDVLATLDATRAKASGEGLRAAAQDVDAGWYAASEGGQVRMRYASDLPQRLNTLRAALAADPAPAGLDELRSAARTLCDFAGRFSAGDTDVQRDDLQVAIDDVRARLQPATPEAAAGESEPRWPARTFGTRYDPYTGKTVPTVPMLPDDQLAATPAPTPVEGDADFDAMATDFRRGSPQVEEPEPMGGWEPRS